MLIFMFICSLIASKSIPRPLSGDEREYIGPYQEQEESHEQQQRQGSRTIAILDVTEDHTSDPSSDDDIPEIATINDNGDENQNPNSKKEKKNKNANWNLTPAMEATATSVVTQQEKTEKPKKKGKQRKKNIENDEVEVPETQFDDSEPSNIPTLEEPEFPPM
ncbi:hypothetical protein KUTeg_006780 [Tegillarca granosa]|uniref:Secreted protein n=1 Tax=Tegillarca granosa TaxID=220873 RepID=A0ABQ9FBB9_TEGGR|nr:hypothetical protein KUTeg_006780 [Tegillarca granosa]